MNLKWWLRPGIHETSRMRAGDVAPWVRPSVTETRHARDLWFAGVLGVLVVLILAGVVSSIGAHAHGPHRKQGVTPGAPAGPVSGYVYDCTGPKLVQEVVERRGETITEVESATTAYGLISQTQYMVFDASAPETCAALTSFNLGTLQSALLVTLTWSQPKLVIK
jgi:hypothetical protein